MLGSRLFSALLLLSPLAAQTGIVTTIAGTGGPGFGGDGGLAANASVALATLHTGANWFWARAENADKDSTLLYDEAPFVLLIDERRLARVQAYTAGYERDIARYAGIGAQFTLYHAPPILAPIYDANPFGVQVFFRVRFRK